MVYFCHHLFSISHLPGNVLNASTAVEALSSVSMPETGAKIS